MRLTKEKRKMLHSSDKARSCSVSDRLRRWPDTTQSAGVSGGADLAHGPVSAGSANHPLRFSSPPACNCQGRCWCDVGEVSAGFLRANAVCYVFIRAIHRVFLAFPKAVNWSKKNDRIYLGKDREHWWEGSSQGNFFHQNTSQRKWSSHLGFDLAVCAEKVEKKGSQK